MSLLTIQATLHQRQGQRQLIADKVRTLKNSLSELEKEHEYAEEAAVIIQHVATATQKELEYHISELVTVALAAVFPNPYEFHVDFVIRRDQTECDITFQREGGEPLDPMSSTGGGPIDVAAFALRVSLWSLQRPRTRPVFLLDEPFRCVSVDLQGKVGEMLQEISKRLGLQIIMISHEKELMATADSVFRTTIANDRTKVEVL